jgi:thioredoxin-dependent peroxiredoxin
MKPHTLIPTVALGLATLLAAAPAWGQEHSLPKVGDRAPLVSGKDQSGNDWRLADVIGKRIVLLYFYPKDDTPGCTKEACGFRDRIGELKKQNVEVIGVSFDPSDSHQKFIAKYNLNFPLIADPTGAIADTYGVRIPGRNMAKRVSFLIGLDGRIVHITNTMNAQTQLDEMSAAIEQLKKS